MATIRAAIALHDGMTGPLRQMNRAVNILLNSFESMQDASNQAIDTASIQAARSALAKANVDFDNIEKSIRDSREEQQKFNQNIRDGENAAGKLLSKFKSVAAVVGGIAGVGKGIQISDQFTNTNARLNLLVDDDGSLKELEKKIMESAQRSRSLYFNVADAVSQIGLNAGNAFDNDMNQVVQFMELINKQFTIGGASAERQKDAMVQLTQAMGAGALRGEELNSILDAAPGIARSIEKYMGIAQGSIKKYAEDGLVTSEVVKNAMFNSAKDIEIQFSQMPKTWSKIWIDMQNRTISVFSTLLEKINKFANSVSVEKVVNGASNALVFLATVASAVFDILTNTASVVVDNWSWLSPIIYGVAAALGVYYGQLMLAKGAELASAAATGALTLAKMLAVPVYAALTGATAASTAAQWGLNSALYACPLVWIIMLIIALIAIFYAAVAAVNHFAGTSVSATGIIAGAFMTALAFIGNIFIALFNLLLELLAFLFNRFFDFANFLANVFVDPVGAIARLFFDLVDNILSLLEALAGAIDTIFGSNLASAVSGWRSKLGGWVEDTFGKGKEIFAEFNVDDYKLDRIQYADAWDAGYSFGEGVDKKIGGLFDFNSMDALGAGSTDAFSMGNMLDGIYNNTGDTSENTAAMSDALDITEEDLSYLRDIAEREAINRFTTAEITINQQNENHIASDMDVDGIMSMWTAGFVEQMNISAEGVHA